MLEHTRFFRVRMCRGLLGLCVGCSGDGSAMLVDVCAPKRQLGDASVRIADTMRSTNIRTFVYVRMYVLHGE
jgi:hypothetical protein